jgi:hypothetical protein
MKVPIAFAYLIVIVGAVVVCTGAFLVVDGPALLQVPLFGATVLWLLALIPAAIVTALKERWPLFLAGWLTFGIVWLVGALALAPPDSWWAKRFYDDRKLRRARDPERYPRSRGTTTVWIAGTLALVVAIGLAAARPSPILGVDGKALAHSVGGGSLIGSNPSCRRIDGNTWSCSRSDSQGSSTVGYRVRLHSFGCWTAKRIGGAGEGSRRRLSGCINILDHLRLFEGIFGGSG